MVVKGKPRERPVQIRDAEDTQTARERSNTVRGGTRMNRKEKNASIKENIVERIKYDKEESTRKYLRPKWDNFRPLETNNTISEINGVLDMFYNQTLIAERDTNTRIIKKNSRGDQLLENIKSVDGLHRIHIMGGEPTINKKFYKRKCRFHLDFLDNQTL